MIESEITEFIDSLIPGLEKEAGKMPVKKTVKCLLDQHPDKVLELYLEDRLVPWLKERVKSFIKPDEDPASVTISTIRNYIEKRYPRYLEYANYHSALARLDQQGPDVLHEVMISVLLKDEDQIFKLYGKRKKDG